MTHDQLFQMIHARPFRPYRLKTAGGREIAVTHPEAIAYAGSARPSWSSRTGSRFSTSTWSSRSREPTNQRRPSGRKAVRREHDGNRLTVDQYDLMVTNGILPEVTYLELIEGRIVEKCRMTPPAACACRDVPRTAERHRPCWLVCPVRQSGACAHAG